MSAAGDMQPDEWALEKQVAKLESDLSKAVREERYADAGDARDALARLHMDDAGAVLSANSDFYTAFSKKSPEKMANLWLESDHVLCIHPGHTPLVGYESITKAWRSMFSSADASFKESVVLPKGVHISVRGNSAWVTCTEEISVKNGPATRSLQATNIFSKSGGRWWLVHHHASPALPAGQQVRFAT
jgi:ketosteroid isomerase-like protein